MHAVMRYTSQDKKTVWEGQKLVSGMNCRPDTAYDDFLRTKLLYHKDDGRMFYHMVQSFPKGSEVDPVTAHAAALKLAEYYKDHEVLVCTHTDRDHVHSHFVINSVNFESGKKLHMAKEQIEELRLLNDKICMEMGLPVFEASAQKKVKPMTIGEYHVAAKGESWKFRLMAAIDECMQYADSADEFITLMRSEGYDVKWTAERRNITYTTPEGMRCRDSKLHDEKYLKENMTNEFQYRYAYVHGGAEGTEQTESVHSTDSGALCYADGEELESGHLFAVGDAAKMQTSLKSILTEERAKELLEKIDKIRVEFKQQAGSLRENFSSEAENISTTSKTSLEAMENLAESQIIEITQIARSGLEDIAARAKRWIMITAISAAGLSALVCAVFLKLAAS